MRTAYRAWRPFPHDRSLTQYHYDMEDLIENGTEDQFRIYCAYQQWLWARTQKF